PQKHKLSGFELRPAYNSLIELKQTAVYEASEEEDPDEEGFEEQIDMVVSLLESKLEGKLTLQFFTFSSMNTTDLTEFKIMFTGHLCLKPNVNELVASTTSLGQNELWYSTNLYRQLLLLESLVPKTTEATARAWIDAFFFGASAMLASNKAMILNMEHVVPATTISPSSLRTLGGFVDYTAIAADECDTHKSASTYLNLPAHFSISRIILPRQYVCVQKVPPVSKSCQLGSHFHLLLHLRKKVICGALTNRHEWIFIFIEFNN
ncbi:hypothetical protein EV702DRAFT_948590, partial [Suillus placidus]